MHKKSETDVIFFPKETTYQIGKTTYIIASHFDENAPSLIAKIKNLLKADIQNELISTTGIPGANMV